MSKKTASQKTVLVGTIGATDPHFVAVSFLARILSDAGFKVKNMGPQCSQKEFINATIETKADAILLSSLCGYAETEVQGFREKLTEAGLGDTVLYIGGNLAMGEQPPEEIKKRFVELGFTRAYPGLTDFDQVIADLKSDLK